MGGTTHFSTMKLKLEGNIMNDLNNSRNLAARSGAGWFRACRGVASARSWILLLLVGWLALVTPLRADNPPTFLFEIDSSAVPGGFNPCGVALDSSNNVYVTDDLNNRVVKFTARGTYLTQWGSSGSGNGQLENPQGIAVDKSNNVYVADSGNKRIEKFDSGGNYLTQWGSSGSGNGQFAGPNGVAVDGGNNVYVTDNYNHRIEKFDANGSYLTQWGSDGTGFGQFADLEGIAVDSSSNVYVADGSNNRVEKFDSNGGYLTQWGGNGTNNGQFNGPAGIAVDSSNNVYVIDSGNYRVEKFATNGNYLAQWGSFGNGNGQFLYLAGIAADSTGNYIYVADFDYNNEIAIGRIQIFVNNANIVPPVITNQPVSQTVPAGINVTFNISVVGAAPLAYEWISNNIAVADATNATLTLSNVSLSASGAYSVTVTNNFGSEWSSDAALTVLPALVTTLPASGLSATGAVLNGSVTVGPEETVVWFDWGTDTNYGNIAGAAVVPGNNGSNNVSAALNGLSGNFYHCRLDAANDFGIVYGDDQVFTVGFIPSATTLPPTNGANGATLEAVVNPEGWDTTVYFKWETPTLTNTTPSMDIGAGAASLNVSSFVPGLASSTPYKYQIVAWNALGGAVGKAAFGDPDQHHYFFSGAETNITLSPGTYIITAYGAPGGDSYNSSYRYSAGGSGAEMSGEFIFSTSTTLTLQVGGAGGGYYNYYGGGGGGGGSFVVEGSRPLVIAGGGGGGGDYYGIVGNGNVSTNGGGGGGYYYHYGAGAGGAGGTNGGGGGIGIGMGYFGAGFGPNYIYGGGGGGGFLGDGELPGIGGSSFENGGMGGGVGYYDAGGGFGGGGGGGDDGAPGGGGGYSGGGGGGYYGRYQPGYGGGGGSIIDSTAIVNLAEVSPTYSPDDPANGEIIITAVPTPLVITTHAALGFTNGAFGFSVIGPSGSNLVIQASTDLQTWIPLQTNLLGSGPFYFSDSNSPANVRRFYRTKISP